MFFSPEGYYATLFHELSHNAASLIMPTTTCDAFRRSAPAEMMAVADSA
jgi:antirestriction protein ArdC